MRSVLLLTREFHRRSSKHARASPHNYRDVGPTVFTYIRGAYYCVGYNRTLISGLRYPIPAAAACGLWSLTRIIYTKRYGTGDPQKV